MKAAPPPPQTPPAEGPTDEELLALIAEVEGNGPMVLDAQPALVEDAFADDEAEIEVPGEPCPHCAQPSLDLETCAICGHAGCLPRDDWAPGMKDPCITRCARCAVLFHVDCGGRDPIGNPACADCKPARDFEDADEWDEEAA